MAETNVAAGARPATASSNVSRTSGASSSARISAVRPASPVGTNVAFSQILGAAPLKREAAVVDDLPITLKAGSGMLSKDVQFLLAETRMQEQQATLPAPSSLGRAIESYSQTQTRVRETIGALRLAARQAETPGVESAA